MTTIIYDHKRKQIACDSRSTADNIVMSDESVKFKYAEDGSLWFVSGSTADRDAFINSFKVDSRTKVDHDFACSATRVKDGKVSIHGIEDCESWCNELEYSRGIGSGYQLAISALDTGMTAKQAVERAMKRDYMSGGKVWVYDVEKGEFVE